LQNSGAINNKLHNVPAWFSSLEDPEDLPKVLAIFSPIGSSLPTWTLMALLLAHSGGHRVHYKATQGQAYLINAAEGSWATMTRFLFQIFRR
jgi:hypothetical protein